MKDKKERIELQEEITTDIQVIKKIDYKIILLNTTDLAF